MPHLLLKIWRVSSAGILKPLSKFLAIYYIHIMFEIIGGGAGQRVEREGGGGGEVVKI